MKRLQQYSIKEGIAGTIPSALLDETGSDVNLASHLLYDGGDLRFLCSGEFPVGKDRFLMKPHQLWIMKYIASRPRQALNSLARKPVDCPADVTMKTLRGLERRGWLKEEFGVFYLTDLGRSQCEESQDH